MGGSYSMASRHRCNILICSIFSTHKGIHKWNTQLCTPHGLCSASFGMHFANPCKGHTGMGRVFAFARTGVVKYCARQNATPEWKLSMFALPTGK